MASSMRTHRTEGPCARAAPLVGRVLRWGAALAVAAPLVAGGAAGPTGIANSAHDLSANSAATVRAVSETNTCKFCHTPHGGQSTQLLWNHEATANAVFNWGNRAGSPVTATNAGTPLPTSLRPESLRCLGCHDGSIALGDVRAGVGDIAIQPSSHVGAGGRLIEPTKLVGAGGNLSGQHPFGIPYANRTYNGVTSAITADRVNTTIKDSYWPVQNGAACNTATHLCTVGTSALAGNVPGVDGAAIHLVPESPGDITNVGIECTTCHDPHNRFGFPKMMRVDTANDALCISCHNM
jgi:predicted CXXCH cytochrome family protein